MVVMTKEEFLKKYLYDSIKIDDIKDNNIRNIKIKYFNMINKVVQDEYRISDKELPKEYDRVIEKEKIELEEYYDTLDDYSIL